LLHGLKFINVSGELLKHVENKQEMQAHLDLDFEFDEANVIKAIRKDIGFIIVVLATFFRVIFWKTFI